MEKQFREYLIAFLFAIIAQFRAMKWRKRKQPLRAIPRNGIPIGNPNLMVYFWTYAHPLYCPSDLQPRGFNSCCMVRCTVMVGWAH